MPIQLEAPIESEAHVEPEAPIQEAEEATVESISSSETESDQGYDMVKRRTMTINRFVPSARPSAQQQKSQGQDQTPPPPSPPSNSTQKRPRIAKQTHVGSSDTPTRTPHQPSKGIVIWEPTTQTEVNMASTSQVVPE